MASDNAEQPPVNPAPRLGLHTCEDLLEKLRWELHQLEKQWDNQFLAFNFAITANHLYADWIKSAGDQAQRRRVNQLPDVGKKLFAVWRDVANASKHWELDQKSRTKQVVSEVSQPQISDWYAYLIAGPVLYLTVEGAKPSLPELTGVTLKCLEWILEAKDQEFPLDLEKTMNVMFRPLQST
ncbi:MAG: hypothetical protein VYC42_17130 [Pseudomonadota bacterium]|nr:hypothetical protein [Pseudomonadota bacterium]